MQNYYNPYIACTPYTNTWLQVQQQRLQNMEQAQRNQMGILKGRQVTNIEEAKACLIDFDGSISIFPDYTNNAIYTKQIAPDGTPIFNVYTLCASDKPIEKVNGNSSINTLTDRVSALEANLEVLKAIVQYEPEKGKEDESNTNNSNIIVTS